MEKHPEHLKNLFEGFPLLGMVIGHVDAFIQSIPVTIKVLAVVVTMLSAYFNLTSDVLLLTHEVKEIRHNQTDMVSGIRHRLDILESMHRK